MKRQAYNPTESFLEGFLLKQGAKGLIRSFKKRWFVLVDGKLTYSRSPYSPEIGHVKMEDCTKLVPKTEGKEGSKKYIFSIQTTFGQQMRWMEAINSYHGMATNSTQPLLESLSASQEAQVSERARRRMTVMYPNLNMEEEEITTRKRPVTMMMADPQLSFSSMHTDIAALTSGLASGDRISPRSGGPAQTVGSLPKEDLSGPREGSSSVSSDVPSSSLTSASSSGSSGSSATHGSNTIASTSSDSGRSPRRKDPTTATPATATATASSSGKGGDDSSDESEPKSNGASAEGDEEDVIVCEKGQDGKGGMGRQMSKLLKRKKDKRTDLLSDLGQRVTALEEQLEVSQQQNEDRKQAQEILNEELLEQRRRYDEEKRKWTAQVDQLKEKYFLSLVVSAKLNYMLSSNDSINVRAPALWEQAATDEVEVEDFTNYIAQHIEAAAAGNDRRRQPGATATNNDSGGDNGKVGYDHYYSYVRDDSDPRRRV